MSKGVTAPLLITGVIVAVGNGWVMDMWNAIYTWTHTGSAIPQATNGTVPVQGLIGGTNVAGVGKAPGYTPAQDIIPGNPNTNPNLS